MCDDDDCDDDDDIAAAAAAAISETDASLLTLKTFVHCIRGLKSRGVIQKQKNNHHYQQQQ